MKYEVNSDKNEVLDILYAIAENGGYCPCQLDQNDDTRCICKDFRENIPVNEWCHCGLYYKTEK